MGLLCFFHRNQTNCPLHSQDFYRNQFPLSSSTHHHQRTHITPTKHRKCTKHRKHISATEKENHIGWRNRAWVCCVFFTETKQNRNQTNCFVWFLWKKTQQTWFLGKIGLGLLCMGLQCLVYGKNTGVVVFYGWVSWRRDWEGNGPEGRLQFEKRMVILCCDSGNSLLW